MLAPLQSIIPSAIFRWLLHPSPRLSQRALHATIWTFGAKGLEHLISYSRIIVLARLLAPGDFGLMAVGLVSIAALETLTKPGFSEALVQKKGKIDEYLDTLWTAGICRTLLIAVVLVLSAPFVAGFFKAPDARPILQVMAVGVLVRGFANSGPLYFYKDLEFQRKSLNELIPIVLETAVAIAVGVLLRNVWALAFGFLAGSVAQVLVSYWSHPYRPRFQRRIHQAKELFAFGRWVYLTRLVTFVANQADSMLLAKMLGPVTLGFYQMAQRVSSIPLQEIPGGFAAVAFPLYSQLQDDLARLQQAFLRTVEAVTSLSLPLAIAILLLGRDFISLALGEKWLPAAAAIQILAIAAAIRSLAGPVGSLFMSSGRPWLGLQMNFLKALTLVVVLYPLTRIFGLSGAAYAVLIASSVSFLFCLYHCLSILHLSMTSMLKAWLPAVSAAAAVTAAALIGEQLFSSASVPGFLGMGVLVLVTYVVFYIFLWWKFKAGLINNLMAIRH